MYKISYPESIYISEIADFVYDHPKNVLIEEEFLVPLYKMYSYYDKNFRPENIRQLILNDSITNLELALSLLKSMELEKVYDYFLYNQNQPDNRSLNTPLAAILEKSSINTENVIGFTHLSNIASVKIMKLLENITFDNALILMTERTIINQLPPFGMYLGNGSVGLKISTAKGYKVVSLATITTDIDGYSNIQEFVGEINNFISEVCKDLNDDYVIIYQNALVKYCNLESHKTYVRIENAELDFQSADVWITLKEYLSNNEYNGRVFLVMTNFRHNICICSILI